MNRATPSALLEGRPCCLWPFTEIVYQRDNVSVATIRLRKGADQVNSNLQTKRLSHYESHRTVHSCSTQLLPLAHLLPCNENYKYIHRWINTCCQNSDSTGIGWSVADGLTNLSLTLWQTSQEEIKALISPVMFGNWKQWCARSI